jgi:site-specific DNA-methyltransferase (adenine-specific)
MYELYHGDCLEILPTLAPKSVDLIFSDIPYGTTKCKWDIVIPFEPMWKCIYLLVKNTTPILLFGSEPFSSLLRTSNIAQYKYDWKWRKSKPSGHLNAKKQPMRRYEDVLVFYHKQCTYNPQGLIEGEFNNNRKWRKAGVNADHTYGSETEIGISKYSGYPSNELVFANPNNNLYHPTQKPVDLLEYLIKTYTNEGDTVLDFTMGSGSTGVAALNTNRNFIGIELDAQYFSIAQERISNV